MAAVIPWVGAGGDSKEDPRQAITLMVLRPFCAGTSDVEVREKKVWERKRAELRPIEEQSARCPLMCPRRGGRRSRARAGRCPGALSAHVVATFLAWDAYDEIKPASFFYGAELAGATALHNPKPHKFLKNFPMFSPRSPARHRGKERREEKGERKSEGERESRTEDGAGSRPHNAPQPRPR